MAADRSDRPRSTPATSAVIGAIWGLVGYALLWGHTPLVIHPTFVQSVLGTIVLFPVRVVLWSIHGIERAAGRPFDFSDNHWWIGAAASAVGAVIVVAVAWGVGRGVRAARGSGREQLAKPSEGV